MRRRSSGNVIQMKRRSSYLLGIFLCLFAVYLLVLFVQSFTREHVSIYEVNQKQLADSENLRGIILRQEELVTAKQSGYVNYYVGEGTRLAAASTVYSIDEYGNASTEAAAADTTGVTLSEEDTQSIRSDIASYRNNFDLSDYSGIVNFHYNIENTLLELSDINLAKNLNKLKKESGTDTSFRLVKAKQTGIISFCSDGLEGLTVDQITPEHFQEMTDQWKQLRTGSSVEKGSPLYRVVSSENWSLVLHLSKEQYIKFAKLDTASVRIKKDDNLLNAAVRTFHSNGSYYANLVFDKYMIHYLNNRYLDVEVYFNGAAGLKIPVSSIVQKECYVIPKEYVNEGDGRSSSGKKGFVVPSYSRTGEERYEFIPAEIYWEDEKGRVYVDTGIFDRGTTIVDDKENGGGRTKMTVTKTAVLDGVYNCNQGYCRFQYVNKLYENQEYAIVEKGNRYSLSNFDHIILNPDMIGEDDIIY